MKIIKLVIDSICLCGIENPLKTKTKTHKHTRSAVAIKYKYEERRKKTFTKEEIRKKRKTLYALNLN
jgi:hypothetical protein